MRFSSSLHHAGEGGCFNSACNQDMISSYGLYTHDLGSQKLDPIKIMPSSILIYLDRSRFSPLNSATLWAHIELSIPVQDAKLVTYLKGGNRLLGPICIPQSKYIVDLFGGIRHGDNYVGRRRGVTGPGTPLLNRGTIVVLSDKNQRFLPASCNAQQIQLGKL